MVMQMPNERVLRQIRAGTETQRGTAAAPTFKLYGDLKINRQQPVIRRRKNAGSFDPYRNNPTYGPVTIDGTYEQALTFEDACILPRYAIAGGVAGVDDTNTTHGYTYTYSPTSGLDDLDTMTIEYGYQGLPFQATLGLFDEFTISADADDSDGAWKWASKLWARTKDLKSQTAVTATGGSTTTLIKSGAGWSSDQFKGAFVIFRTGTANNIGQVRQVSGNTATTLTFSKALPAAVSNTDTAEISALFTAGISDRATEDIPAAGTKLYIDDGSGTIGTTLITDKMTSFSVTYANNVKGKRFLNNSGNYSKKIGRGDRLITGQVTLEFDDWAEYSKWGGTAPTARKLRISQTGSTIDSGAGTKKSVSLDLPNIYWDTADPEAVREENGIVTLGFLAFVDANAGSAITWTAKSTLSTLP